MPLLEYREYHPSSGGNLLAMLALVVFAILAFFLFFFLLALGLIVWIGHWLGVKVATLLSGGGGKPLGPGRPPSGGDRTIDLERDKRGRWGI